MTHGIFILGGHRLHYQLLTTAIAVLTAVSRFTACEAAGVPELKFHDLRRTAVRNMRRAGVPQVVRMKITGHRTDSMERRYNIVDIDDIKSAREMMQKRKKDED